DQAEILVRIVPPPPLPWIGRCTEGDVVIRRQECGGDQTPACREDEDQTRAERIDQGDGCLVSVQPVRGRENQRVCPGILVVPKKPLPPTSPTSRLIIWPGRDSARVSGSQVGLCDERDTATIGRAERRCGRLFPCGALDDCLHDPRACPTSLSSTSRNAGS